MNPISCTVKPPHHLSIGESEFHSGCSVIEVIFPNHGVVSIGKITFVNNYTAHVKLNVKIQEKGSDGRKTFQWKTLVRKQTLMPNPHFETGSQNYFTLGPNDFNCKANNITAVRFILSQPSPNWKAFSIEEIYFFQKPSSKAQSSSVPHWLTSPQDEIFRSSKNDTEPSDQARLSGLPDPDELSLRLQQMWMLTDKVEGSAPNIQLGRFDIDGCYEINLLSYS